MRRKSTKLTSEISSSWRVTAVFAVRVSPGGPTPAPDEPPASDNAPATPNIVKAFVPPLRIEFFRFEFRLPCDMVEASDFTPALICNYTPAFDGVVGEITHQPQGNVRLMGEQALERLVKRRDREVEVVVPLNANVVEVVTVAADRVKGYR